MSEISMFLALRAGMTSTTDVDKISEIVCVNVRNIEDYFYW